MIAYFIGPESNVWHRRLDCSRLKNHYWPIHTAEGKEAEEVKRTRNACKVCVPYSPRELEDLAAQSPGEPMTPREKRPAGGGRISRGS